MKKAELIALIETVCKDENAEITAFVYNNNDGMLRIDLSR